MRRPSRLAAALPFVITALVAAALSLGAQALLFPRQPLAVIAPTAQPTTTSAPAGTPAPPTLTAAPTAAPTPAPAEGVLRLDILDLEEEDRQLWSALYLLRAASQLDDAVAALQVNDLDEADRTLLTAYRSLDRAYAFSAEQEKGPIDTFRLSISQIRDDLRLRPEGADRRLRQLRRLILSLVDEGG
jgi:hypothetical protein